jgi:hypothetical protein
MATPVNYTHELQLTAAVQTLVPASTNQQDTVTSLVFTNTGTVRRLVTVYVVKSGGTAGVTNQLAPMNVQPGKSLVYTLAIGRTFINGMTLQAKVDAGTDVNVNCDGVVST